MHHLLIQSFGIQLHTQYTTKEEYANLLIQIRYLGL